MSGSADLSGKARSEGNANLLALVWPFENGRCHNMAGYAPLTWQVADIRETDRHVLIELIAPVAGLLEKAFKLR